MTLREQIAKHLWDTQTLYDRRLYSSDKWEDICWREQPTKELFLRFADECIRQMEWAARLGFEEGCESEAGTTYDTERAANTELVHPVIAAPEGWKP